MTTLDLRLAVTDMPVGDLPVYAKCPNHNDKKRPNLAVYVDSIHCYVCGYNRMGAWGLAALLKVGIDEARAAAERYTSEGLDAYRERAATEARRDPMPTALAQVYSHVLTHGPRKSRLDWLRARGLTDQTIGDNLLGHDGNRFVIPVFDAGANLISLRFRRDDEYQDEGYPKYSGVKGRNGLYLYPEDLISRAERKLLVICEGELDALRLWQENIPAVSATNGAGQAPKLPALIRERWPSVESLFIATDQDEPGEEAARLTAERAQALGFRTYRVQWREGKDVTEAIALGSLDPKHFGLYAAAIG